MLRSVALTLAAVLIARVHAPRMTTAAPGDQDIHQLMTSARNAPAPLCALAVASTITVVQRTLSVRKQVLSDPANAGLGTPAGTTPATAERGPRDTPRTGAATGGATGPKGS